MLTSKKPDSSYNLQLKNRLHHLSDRDAESASNNHIRLKIPPRSRPAFSAGFRIERHLFSEFTDSVLRKYAYALQDFAYITEWYFSFTSNFANLNGCYVTGQAVSPSPLMDGVLKF